MSVGEDRWCTNCNAYRTKVRCGCGKLTEMMQVVPVVRNAPKVRCGECKAPFAGLRFERTDLPIGYRWNHKLQKKSDGSHQLTVNVTAHDPENVLRSSGGSYDSWTTAVCPHCERDLLRVHAQNISSTAAMIFARVLADPSGELVLVVTAVKGELRGAH